MLEASPMIINDDRSVFITRQRWLRIVLVVADDDRGYNDEDALLSPIEIENHKKRGKKKKKRQQKKLEEEYTMQPYQLPIKHTPCTCEICIPKSKTDSPIEIEKPKKRGKKKKKRQQKQLEEEYTMQTYQPSIKHTPCTCEICILKTKTDSPIEIEKPKKRGKKKKKRQQKQLEEEYTMQPYQAPIKHTPCTCEVCIPKTKTDSPIEIEKHKKRGKKKKKRQQKKLEEEYTMQPYQLPIKHTPCTCEICIPKTKTDSPIEIEKPKKRGKKKKKRQQKQLEEEYTLQPYQAPIKHTPCTCEICILKTKTDSPIEIEKPKKRGKKIKKRQQKKLEGEYTMQPYQLPIKHTPCTCEICIPKTKTDSPIEIEKPKKRCKKKKKRQHKKLEEEYTMQPYQLPIKHTPCTCEICIPKTKTDSPIEIEKPKKRGKKKKKRQQKQLKEVYTMQPYQPLSNIHHALVRFASPKLKLTEIKKPKKRGKKKNKRQQKQLKEECTMQPYQSPIKHTPCTCEICIPKTKTDSPIEIEKPKKRGKKKKKRQQKKLEEEYTMQPYHLPIKHTPCTCEICIPKTKTDSPIEIEKAKKRGKKKKKRQQKQLKEEYTMQPYQPLSNIHHALVRFASPKLKLTGKKKKKRQQKKLEEEYTMQPYQLPIKHTPCTCEICIPKTKTDSPIEIEKPKKRGKKKKKLQQKQLEEEYTMQPYQPPIKHTPCTCEICIPKTKTDSPIEIEKPKKGGKKKKKRQQKQLEEEYTMQPYQAHIKHTPCTCEVCIPKTKTDSPIEIEKHKKRGKKKKKRQQKKLEEEYTMQPYQLPIKHTPCTCEICIPKTKTDSPIEIEKPKKRGKKKKKRQQKQLKEEYTMQPYQPLSNIHHALVRFASLKLKLTGKKKKKRQQKKLEEEYTMQPYQLPIKHTPCTCEICIPKTKTDSPIEIEKPKKRGKKKKKRQQKQLEEEYTMQPNQPPIKHTPCTCEICIPKTKTDSPIEIEKPKKRGKKKKKRQQKQLEEEYTMQPYQPPIKHTPCTCEICIPKTKTDSPIEIEKPKKRGKKKKKRQQKQLEEEYTMQPYQAHIKHTPCTCEVSIPKTKTDSPIEIEKHKKRGKKKKKRQQKKLEEEYTMQPYQLPIKHTPCTCEICILKTKTDSPIEIEKPKKRGKKKKKRQQKQLKEEYTMQPYQPLSNIHHALVRFASLKLKLTEIEKHKKRGKKKKKRQQKKLEEEDTMQPYQLPIKHTPCTCEICIPKTKTDSPIEIEKPKKRGKKKKKRQQKQLKEEYTMQPYQPLSNIHHALVRFASLKLKLTEIEKPKKRGKKKKKRQQKQLEEEYTMQPYQPLIKHTPYTCEICIPKTKTDSPIEIEKPKKRGKKKKKRQQKQLEEEYTMQPYQAHIKHTPCTCEVCNPKTKTDSLIVIEKPKKRGKKKKKRQQKQLKEEYTMQTYQPSIKHTPCTCEICIPKTKTDSPIEIEKPKKRGKKKKKRQQKQLKEEYTMQPYQPLSNIHHALVRFASLKLKLTEKEKAAEAIEGGVHHATIPTPIKHTPCTCEICILKTKTDSPIEIKKPKKRGKKKKKRQQKQLKEECTMQPYQSPIKHTPCTCEICIPKTKTDSPIEIEKPKKRGKKKKKRQQKQLEEEYTMQPYQPPIKHTSCTSEICIPKTKTDSPIEIEKPKKRGKKKEKRQQKQLEEEYTMQPYQPPIKHTPCTCEICIPKTKTDSPIEIEKPKKRGKKKKKRQQKKLEEEYTMQPYQLPIKHTPCTCEICIPKTKTDSPIEIEKPKKRGKKKKKRQQKQLKEEYTMQPYQPLSNIHHALVRFASPKLKLTGKKKKKRQQKQLEEEYTMQPYQPPIKHTPCTCEICIPKTKTDSPIEIEKPKKRGKKKKKRQQKKLEEEYTMQPYQLPIKHTPCTCEICIPKTKTDSPIEIEKPKKRGKKKKKRQQKQLEEEYTMQPYQPPIKHTPCTCEICIPKTKTDSPIEIEKLKKRGKKKKKRQQKKLEEEYTMQPYQLPIKHTPCTCEICIPKTKTDSPIEIEKPKKRGKKKKKRQQKQLEEEYTMQPYQPPIKHTPCTCEICIPKTKTDSPIDLVQQNQTQRASAGQVRSEE
ncbi:hypothetical protein QVD17_16341 [Tagetes erecta]|uniref:Uncharacterized protein n=1 Tax=Tagetes erecta TaxID=13708 RepID=A0AAD8NTG0_TARER|nr:hypothetical protein QVD17_16341 [Tagetes erecta]